MSSLRLITLEVEVSTLRRRLESIERHLLGDVSDLPGPQPLFALYSHLVLDGLQPSGDAAAMMRASALMLSPRMLLDLGRMLQDPFPWRPFLAALDLLEVHGFDVAEASSWVQGCAEDLLKAQGLEMLRVEDVLRSPTGPLHELKSFALSER